MSLQVLPTGMTTASAGLAYLQQEYVKKEALDQLWEIFRFRDACEKYTIPKNSGLTLRVNRWDNMSIGTNASTEGDQSAPLTISNRTATATLSQFTSLINVSDLLVDTAPDDIIASAAKQLGYRAGRTVDIMTRNIIDSQAHNFMLTAAGATLTVADLRAARHGLRTNNVPTMSDGLYLAYVHPLNSYDLINDPAANGYADIHKYTTAQPMKTYNDNDILQTVAGCKVVEVTNCFGYSSSGNKYRTYVFGKGGFASVDLAGRGPSSVTDPKSQAFKINVHRAASGGNGLFDPEGVIGGAVAYNMVTTGFFTSGVDPIGGLFRMRAFDTTPTIAA